MLHNVSVGHLYFFRSSREAPKTLKRVLKPCNMEQMDVLRILGKPSGPTLDECQEYGAEIARNMLET